MFPNLWAEASKETFTIARPCISFESSSLKTLVLKNNGVWLLFTSRYTLLKISKSVKKKQFSMHSFRPSTKIMCHILKGFVGVAKI